MTREHYKWQLNMLYSVQIFNNIASSKQYHLCTCTELVASQTLPPEEVWLGDYGQDVVEQWNVLMVDGIIVSKLAAT